MEKAVRDSYGRTIEYMRISITDRCNLRCRYCMPDGAKWIPMSEILTYEEIERICREAVRIGITRFKITGGEPLVRKGCADLIRMIRQIPGTEEVTMTTNGVLLGENLEDLLAAGLDAVNISLDTLIPEKYQEITGADELERVRKSIFMAEKSEIRVKINTVLQKGVNDEEWKSLAELAKKNKLDVRCLGAWKTERSLWNRRRVLSVRGTVWERTCCVLSTAWFSGENRSDQCIAWKIL